MWFYRYLAVLQLQVKKLKVFYVAPLLFSCVAVAVQISDCPCFFIFLAVLQLQLLLNSAEKVL